MKLTKILAAGVILLALSACSSSRFDGYEETENGLFYRFITHSGDTDRPQVGDYVFVQMVNKFTEDSVLYNSFESGRPNGVVTFQLRQPAFKGSLEEAIMLMSTGDSALFKISADSIYSLIPKEDSAEAFPPGTFFTFELKLVKVMTAQQMQDEQQKKYQAYLEEIQRKSAWNKENEAKVISDYLSMNKIETKALKSGLIYIEHEKGKGTMPVKGSKLAVNYVGRTLVDGEVFDASDMHGGPMTYEFGGQPMIKGWDEGLSMMKAGGKATLILPSALAYDSMGSISPTSGMYSILPYAPIMFEIELLEVK